MQVGGCEEREHAEEDKEEPSTVSAINSSPRIEDLVMDKMIQVMELLEKRTRELEARLNAAEVKIAQLATNKAPRGRQQNEPLRMG